VRSAPVLAGKSLFSESTTADALHGIPRQPRVDDGFE